MVTGFFRLKDRMTRRSTFAIEGRWPFFKRRAGEITHMLREYAKLYFEMQELWLLTRIRRDDNRRGTHRTLARLELWRPHPLEWVWNLARRTRHALVFLVAMRGERC